MNKQTRADTWGWGGAAVILVAVLLVRIAGAGANRNVLDEGRVVSNWRTIAAASDAATTSTSKHVLVYFIDYRCAVCAILDSVIKRANLAGPDFSLVRRHAPIVGGETSRRAARLILCAERRFTRTDLHDTLIRHVSDQASELNRLTARIRKTRSGAELLQCEESDWAHAALDTELAVARSIGIDRTPAILLDSILLLGLPSDFERRLRNWSSDR